MSDRKYSFSELARHLNVHVEDIKNCVMVERICIPERVASNGDKVDFEFGNLPIGDKVTNEGVILATINSGGDASRPNWTTIEAGQFFVREADVDLVRARFAAGPTSESTRKESPKDRRARLLAWLEEEASSGGERGALTRVFEREKIRNPKADRSNVGKDIKKAEAERAEAKRAGHWGMLSSSKKSG